MLIDPAAAESLRALLLGLAFSGLIASAFECATGRRAGAGLLGTGFLGEGRAAVLLLVPILAVSAPFLILRRALVPPRFERRRPAPVMAATVLAGLWALAFGQVMLMLAQGIAAA